MHYMGMVSLKNWRLFKRNTSKVNNIILSNLQSPGACEWCVVACVMECLTNRIMHMS